MDFTFWATKELFFRTAKHLNFIGKTQRTIVKMFDDVLKLVIFLVLKDLKNTLSFIFIFRALPGSVRRRISPGP